MATWRIWRPARGEPWWARVGLLVIAAGAGVLYGVDSAGNLEVFYAAADRSMAASWHDFLFAAFDPAGTVTLDKLPGAFWVQALSVRAFGPHPWAVVAPQVVEGVLAVLVLARVVSRLRGPLAGLLAAAMMATFPAIVALDRGNIADSLMILLLLLAADAVVSALDSGAWRWLVLAGVWVGLAFQAKMLEAWLVLPALAVCLLACGGGTLLRRVVGTAVLGAVTAVVSLSWMTAVSLVPQSSRPWVDGSQHDSLWAQVFSYNGFGRIDQASPNQILSRTIGLQIGTSTPPAWDRLLRGSYGADAAWLYPAALVGLVAIVVLGVRAGRRSPLLAAGLLWGLWAVVLFGAFSKGTTINPYYLAALGPPVAALVGTGAAAAWEHRSSAAVRPALAATVLVSAGYGAWLLPRHGAGLPPGLWIVVAVVGVVAAGAVLVAGRAGLGAAVVAVLLVPTVASVSLVVKGFGPFDTPFEGRGADLAARAIGGIANGVRPSISRIELVEGRSALAATQTSVLAAPFIFDTGREVVPIGGYTGQIPAPSLATLEAMVAAGDFHLVIAAAGATDPRLVWIAQHCHPLGTTRAGTATFVISYCGAAP